MDEDDEKLIVEFEDPTKMWLGTHSPPYLKLLEDQQRTTMALDRRSGTSGLTRGLFCQRFFRTVAGFHTGSLDLSGRHEARYTSLLQRWDPFLADLINLRAHCTSREEVICDPDGQPISFHDGTTFKMTVWSSSPIEVEEDFRKKYHLQGLSIALELLMDQLESVSDILAANPTPRLQRLTLLHLPPELLHLIMGYTSVDEARALGATCQALRAVSLSYVYETRSLLLTGKRDDTLPIDEQVDDLRQNALRLRNKLLSEIKFLLARPDIQREVKQLSVGNDWAQLRGLVEEIGADPAKGQLYAPVFLGWCKSIMACENLGCLSLVHVTLTLDLLRAAVSMPRLHTIIYHEAKLSNRAGPIMLSGGISRSLSIINIEILSPKTMWDPWYPVALCPRVKTLSVRGLAHTVMLPMDNVRDAFNPFLTLERLVVAPVNNINLDNVTNFARWIREAADALAPHPLPLTHFFFQTQRRMTDTGQSAIIDALRGSQLQSLVLENLERVHPSLITRIAEGIPHLRALSLGYRPTDFHDGQFTCIWPHPTWEYAARLAAFRSLEHFAWNCRLGSIADDVSIADLFATDDDRGGEAQSRLDQDEDDDWSPDASVVRLFSVHCPTLRSFAMIDRLALSNAWKITIDSNTGEKHFEFEYLMRNFDYYPSWRLTWPAVNEDPSSS